MAHYVHAWSTDRVTEQPRKPNLEKPQTSKKEKKIVIIAKSDGLSSIPAVHMVEEEN